MPKAIKLFNIINHLNTSYGQIISIILTVAIKRIIVCKVIKTPSSLSRKLSGNQSKRPPKKLVIPLKKAMIPSFAKDGIIAFLSGITNFFGGLFDWLPDNFRDKLDGVLMTLQTIILLMATVKIIDIIWP